MNDKEKRDDRFKMRADDIEVTFRPQCNTCIFNVDLNSCQKFEVKPYEYLKNIETCPKKEKNI